MTNTKFKVGDKVRVAKLMLDSLKEKERFMGRTFEITRINTWSGKWIYISEDGDCRYNWCEEELELVEAKQFSKSDLKDGMVVEYRDGRKALYINDSFISGQGQMPLSSYGDHLLRRRDAFAVMLLGKDGHPYDIVKVYKTDACTLSCLTDDKYLELIWERKEEKKAEPKYKVGDRVKVRDDLTQNQPYGPISCTSKHYKLKGQVVTITRADSDFTYLLKDDSLKLWWSEDMFEGVVDYEEMTVEEIEKKLGYKIKVIADK